MDKRKAPAGEGQEYGANIQRNRREEMAQIARRRAAHFAAFDVGDVGAQAADAEHARSLGPWSSAVQLANAREKELEKRQTKIMEDSRRGPGANGNMNWKTDEPLEWTPRRDISLGQRKQCHVKPLSHMTLRLVVDFIAHVETLCGVPDLVKAQIAAEVCARRALTGDTLRLFTANTPTEVYIPDCSQLDADTLTPALLEAATLRLERLDLGLCGRGLTDATAKQLADGGVLSSLRHLRLSGAYRLSDTGLSVLLKSMPCLESLCVCQAPRIEGPAVQILPQATPQLKILDLAECRGLRKSALLTAIIGLPQLEDLNLDGILEVTGPFVRELAEHAVATPKGLVAISLASCNRIFDADIESLAATCKTLTRVCLDECPIGDAAVRALADHCKGLQDISLSRCQSVSDVTVQALAGLAFLRRVCLNGATKVTGAGVRALALGACCTTLEEVDLSWCRGIEVSSLGLLADSCPGLKRLFLWGCTQADDSFLAGHSNDVLTVVGRGEVLLPVVLC